MDPVRAGGPGLGRTVVDWRVVVGLKCSVPISQSASRSGSPGLYSVKGDFSFCQPCGSL